MNLKLYKIVISSFDSAKNDIEITIKTTNTKDAHTIPDVIKKSLYDLKLLTGGCSVEFDDSTVDVTNFSLLRTK